MTHKHKRVRLFPLPKDPVKRFERLTNYAIENLSKEQLFRMLVRTKQGLNMLTRAAMQEELDKEPARLTKRKTNRRRQSTTLG